MAKSSDHDFWKGQFDLGGNLTSSWFGAAFDLLTAADVLDRFKGDIRGEILKDMDSGARDGQGMTQLPV